MQSLSQVVRQRSVKFLTKASCRRYAQVTKQYLFWKGSSHSHLHLDICLKRLRRIPALR
jgi:hypothetical protein